MATKRKTAARKPRSRTSGALTKTKIRRVARKTKASLTASAHDANLALRRTARKLKRTAEKMETTLREAKAPAKRRAKRAGRKLASALERAGQSLAAAARKAKSRLVGARRKLKGTPGKKSPATKSSAGPARRKRAARS